MNLVLTIFALALALALTVLVVTWCTVLAALREGLADEDEPYGESGGEDGRADDRDRDRDDCLAGACREAGRV